MSSKEDLFEEAIYNLEKATGNSCRASVDTVKYLFEEYAWMKRIIDLISEKEDIDKIIVQAKKGIASEGIDWDA